MSSYEALLADALVVLKKHKLDQYAADYDVELINYALRKDVEKLRAADSFDSILTMANEALTSQMTGGMLPNWMPRMASSGYVNSFITSYMPSTDDQDHLYMLFSAWRAMLLKEIEGEEQLMQGIAERQA